MRYVVAANIRARLAWSTMTFAELQEKMGWTRRTTHNKVHGHTGLVAEEVAAIAELLGCDPGTLYKVPDGFPELVSSPSVSTDSQVLAA